MTRSRHDERSEFLRALRLDALRAALQRGISSHYADDPNATCQTCRETAWSRLELERLEGETRCPVCGHHDATHEPGGHPYSPIEPLGAYRP